jgi:hypothetical protein
VAVGSFSDRSRLWNLVTGLLVLGFGVTIAVYPLQDPPPTLPGYTTSLSLILLPLAALLAWFLRRKDRLSCEWKALWRTAALIFPAWIALDVVLAHRLFCFPDPGSTVGLNLPGYAPALNTCAGGGPIPGWGLNIPAEELVFYLGSCLVVILLYIWSSQEWFEAYSTPHSRIDEEERHIRRALQLHRPILLWGLALLAAVCVYKRFGPHEYREGLPVYGLLLIGFSIVPNVLLYRALGRFVNERALLFTMSVVVLVSLIWEVTLALPHGWWDYQREQMMGLTITPWSRLPIEAVVLWVAAGWGNVILYEFFRFQVHSGRKVRSCLVGR